MSNSLKGFFVIKNIISMLYYNYKEIKKEGGIDEY